MKAWIQGNPIVSLIACVGTAILLLTSAGQANQNLPAGGFGMFSWNDSVMAEGEKDALSSCIKQAGVKVIYQEIPEERLMSEETADFVRRMGKQSVEVYALMGDSEWAYEREGGSLLYALEQLAAYNKAQKRDARIAGVMVDVEPYLLEEWDNGRRSRNNLMERYLSGMEKAYAYASKNGLKFWACIPNFYDVTNEDILEELISSACDGIAIMNYDRTDEYMQVAKEVGYAREYQKGVVCIYELQKPGVHDLKKINTYAEIGLDGLWESARRLEKQFGYSKLQFAYHYYSPLQTLLEQGS